MTLHKSWRILLGGMAMAFLGLFGAVHTSSAAALGSVINGGFEQGKANWWGPGFEKGTATVVKEAAPEGTDCLKLGAEWICQDKITVQGGKRYKISMKVRSDGAPESSIYVQFSYRGPGLTIQWYGPAEVDTGSGSEKILFATGGTHAWKTFSVVVEAPPSADQILFYLRRNGDVGAGYFDDIKCEPTDDAVTPATQHGTGARKETVLNGGFEKGNANWWGAGFDGHTASVVKDGAAEGEACLKLTSEYVCQDKIPLQGGKRYKISMKLRGDEAPDGSIYVQVSYRGNGVGAAWYGPVQVNLGGRTEQALFVSGGTQEWKTVSAVVEPPKNADQLLIYLRKKTVSAGAAYFDDIKVEPTDEPATTAGALLGAQLSAKLLSPPLAAADAAAAINVLLVAAAQPTPAKLTLIEDGTIEYQVHVATHADLLTLNAAKELNDYLGKISAASAAALSHDEHPTAGPLLIVGRDSALTQKLCPNIPYAELGEDGFVIRTVGPHIVIAGATSGATMYGVNWFLDHKLGVKWLSPDYTYVPASKTLAIAAVRETQVPRFAFRQILSAEGQNKRFAAHNLLNGNSHGAYSVNSPPEINHWDSTWQRPGLVGSFFELVPPAQFQGPHPDWYYGGQIAMMNPGVRQALADAVIKRLKRVDDYQNYWFGLMDNDWGWDTDPASAAFAKNHGGVPSAAQLDMVGDVLQRVRKVLPGAKIAFNAYHWGFTPPTGMTVPDGLRVFPMTIQLDYSTPLFIGRNVKLGKDIEGWNTIAKHILIWDHITNFNGYIQPTPNIYPICETIRWLATLAHIHGYFAEGSWNTKDGEFASLRVWIMGRMLWDPGTDYKAAIAEYCDDYYGPAGKYIRQYIDLMHDESAKTHAPIWEKTNIDSAMLNLDFATQADALMETAQAAVVADPVFLKHVLEVRVCVDYVILVRRKEYQHQAASRHVQFNVDFANRLDRFNQTIKDEGFTQYRQDGTMAELAGIIAIDRKDSTPPKLVGGLPKSAWREIQEIGFNRYYASTIVVADSTASDGAAARLDGHQMAPLIQLKHHKLPEEGLWDIYAEVRVDANDADPNDVALGIGTMPPQDGGTNIKMSQLKDGGYTLIKAPGGPYRYNQDDQVVTFIRGGPKSKYVYVDRFFVVRVAPKPTE